MDRPLAYCRGNTTKTEKTPKFTEIHAFDRPNLQKTQFWCSKNVHFSLFFGVFSKNRGVGKNLKKKKNHKKCFKYYLNSFVAG